jgi:hypothetical protein
LYISSKLVASLIIAIIVSVPAAADEATIPGLWSTTSDKCGQGDSGWDNIGVYQNRIRWHEGGCDFSGGIQENDYHWIMRGKCCSEGECQDYDKLPEKQIDLSSSQGVLKLNIQNDENQSAYYAVKCGESSDTPPPLSPAQQAAQVSSRRTFWNHNGSTVYLDVSGTTRRFHYAKPRPGMIKAGARSGTLLFDGSSDGREYSGTAYIFDARCGRYPYKVHGPILKGGSRVVLHGNAPIVDGNCKIKRYIYDTLDFRLLPGQ